MASFAGGIIGTLIGGPIGGMIGSFAGSIVDRMIFGSGGLVREGPRINEFRLMRSALGESVPLVDGAMRFTGQVIWMSEVREHVKNATSKQGGFLGVGGQEVTDRTYSYRVDMAILLARAPAVSVPKIWRQNELVRDLTGSTQVNSELLGAFSIRLGDDDEPDPIYEAAVGADNAQAWRGMVVLMLYDHDVTDFGQIPQFSAVVTTASTSNKPYTLLADVDGNLDQLRHACWAPDRKRLYIVDLASGPSRVNVIDSPTATQLFSGPLDQVYLNDPGIRTLPCIDYLRGRFYYAELLSGSTAVITQYDGASFQILAQSELSGSPPVGAVAFPASTLLAVPILNLGVVIGERVFASSYSSSSQFAVLHTLPLAGTDNGNGNPILPLLQLHDLVAHYGAGWESDDLVLDQEGTPWLIADNGTDLKMVRLEPSLGAPVESFTLAGKAGHRNAGYCAATHSIVTFRLSDLQLMRWSIDDEAIAGTLTLAAVSSEFEARNSLKGALWSGLLWLQKDADEFVEIDTLNMTLLRTIDADDWLAGSRLGCVYDPLTHSIVTTVPAALDDVLWLRLDRETLNGVTLQSVIERKAELVGMDVATEISAGALSADTVYGHHVLQRAPASESGEALSAPYFFNPAERDRLLAFVKRGGATVASIPADDLGAREVSTAGTEAPRRPIETPQAELTLPYRLEGGYFSTVLDWQPEVQEAKRHAPAASTRREIRMGWPLAFTEADTPKQIVEKLLKQQWNASRRYEFALGPEYSDLIPTDPVSLTDPDGVVHRIILTDVAIGANGLVKCKGYSEEIATSSAAGVAAPGTPQTIQPVPVSAAHLWDGPAPDESFSAEPYLLLAAGPYGGSTGWPGYVLFNSADGFAIDDQAAVVPPSAAATLGYAVTALAAPFEGCAPGQFDWWETVDVGLWNGSLTSATRAQIDGGKTNLARLGGEYFQFQTVTALGNNKYRLSGLKRGLRGTEDQWGAHVAGEAFVLLAAGTIVAVPLATGDINVERFFRGATVGASLASALSLSVTAIGRSAMPWAPWEVEGARDGSNHWNLTFERRVAASNRHDMSGMPEAPQPIDFEAEILSPAGAVVRTITTTATAAGSAIVADPDNPTLTYKSADQVTDFGANQTILRGRLYQIAPLPVGSAGDGRGIARAFTLSALAFDPYWSSVVLACNFEAADGSTTFTDSSLSAHALTPSGNAQHDTAETFGFGTSSYLGDGSGDYLTVGAPNQYTDFNFGSGDYTVEAWFVSDVNTSIRGILTRLASGNAGLALTLTAAGKVQWSCGAGAHVLLSNTTVAVGSRYHVAVSRNGQTCRLFINGLLEDSDAADDVTATASLSTYVGSGAADLVGRSFDGWIKGLRVTKGVGRHTESFVPSHGLLPVI